mmetsp:Transcript_22382/g.27424  ORF Transcript_22382/g.27424 Transcript_22382/m.27424 type:complete len:483 (+) Transcript_22382:117-1565(+)
MNNQSQVKPNTIQAPTYSVATQAAVATRGTPSTLNLDDIFGDCFFTPEGDTVFLSEQPQQNQQQGSGTNDPNQQGISSNVLTSGEGGNVASFASRMVKNEYVPVAQAGGIVTTGLSTPGAVVTTMGPAASATNSTGVTTATGGGFTAQPSQQRHHMQFAIPNPSTMSGAGSKKRGGAAAISARERKMSDQQKSERRERNREHAKRSRIRKKILLESLQQSVSLLKEENDKLRNSIRHHLGDETANELLTKENLLNENENLLIASNSKDANKVLDDPDFSFIKALQTAQQNFVVTDPSLPDNPIVYATQGFLNLTGYALDQVLGRNCRFLQGPETDPKAVEKIRRAIEDGSDMSVCLLNYRVDGSTFWNQFFISALRDAAGNITNYVGVQCKVSDQYAANVCKRQEEQFANADAAMDEGVEGDSNMSMNDNKTSSGGDNNDDVNFTNDAVATGTTRQENCTITQAPGINTTNTTQTEQQHQVS